MTKKSPWSTRRPLPPSEIGLWLIARDLDAIQWRIDNLEVPEHKHEFKTPVVTDHDELVDFLVELMKK